MSSNKYENITKMRTTFYKSPIGDIEILGNNKGIYSVEFCPKYTEQNFLINKRGNPLKCHDNSQYHHICENFQDQVLPLEECKKQLDEYFKGKRKDFSLEIIIEKGTEFQRRVWNALLDIPYGETVTYGKIAKAINNDKAARAVGNANNKNPISIIIPCHRVIGSNGKLVGYGGGLWRKEWLLKHEKNN